MRIELSVVVLTVSCIFGNNVHAATLLDGWFVSYQYPPPKNTIGLCMHKSSNGGIFSRAKWNARPIHNYSIRIHKECSDVVYLSIKRKMIYLNYKLNYLSGGLFGNKRYIHCEPDSRFGIYTGACHSPFFYPYIRNPRIRILNISEISAAVISSSAIDVAEKYKDQLQSKENNKRHAEYLLAYKNAHTVIKIDKFIHKYRDNDPDGLINLLESKKQKILYTEYKDEYHEAKSLAEMKAFIIKFRHNDPNHYIEILKPKIALTEHVLRAKQKLAKQKAEKANLKSRIRYCQAETKQAYQVIVQQRQIGAITGYQDKHAMYNAGLIIVSCKSMVPHLYATYKQLGGKETLRQIER